MIKKTSDYDKFILRHDNREKIDKNHVQKLCASISARNLLELRPIVVNEKMEVIDGQHRLQAAKILGVEIYYQEQKQLAADDIIKMNISKSWTMGDYLNFYCKNENPEYIKLKQFIDKNRLNLKIAIQIAMGRNSVGYKAFRDGKFKFDEQVDPSILEICWETVDYIKKVNGYSAYSESGRFWNALLKMIRHSNFAREKWMGNLKMMIGNVSPKADSDGYLKMFLHIYNWRNTDKIEFAVNQD